MFLVQDYRPNDDSFGYPLALPQPQEFGVPEGYDIPIFQIFFDRDYERIEVGDTVSVVRKKR